MTELSLEHQQLIDRFQQEAPVNVTGLAEALGLAVWEDEDLPIGVSGKIFRDPDGGGASGYSISVRASDALVRRRFTLAHEIAHFLLHKNRIGDSLTDDALYRSGLSNWEEVEANRLAADILMPRKLIVHYARTWGYDPETLCNFFKVSAEAMRIRLSAASGAA